MSRVVVAVRIDVLAINAIGIVVEGVLALSLALVLCDRSISLVRVAVVSVVTTRIGCECADAEGQSDDYDDGFHYITSLVGWFTGDYRADDTPSSWWCQWYRNL